MNPPPHRRFTIADIMILVVAAALAMLILRFYMPGHYRELLQIPDYFNDRYGLWRAYFWAYGPGSCLVVPAMAGLIMIRLRKPRPRRIRLAGQPGFVACLAVMASLVPGLLWYLTIRHRTGFQQPDLSDQHWKMITHWTGTAVAGAWIALALARRWRPEPSWIDRSGRVLGLYWIVTLAWSIGLMALDRLLNFLSRS